MDFSKIKNFDISSTTNCRCPKSLLCSCSLWLITILFFSCTQREPSRAEFALGTICLVNLYEQGTNRAYQKIFNRIREIENRMSVNIPDSDVSRINAAAGIEPVQVHEDVFTVIERALYFAELSGGAFDPTVGPLVSLWGIGTENPRVPRQTEIDEALSLINWRNIELDRQRRSVLLKYSGMALDLGAIAKGYAADEAAAAAKEAGIERALFDLGGDIVACGIKKDRSLWRVGIQNPNGRRGEFIGIVNVSASVVTSGVYERFFEKDGTRYHHIFSPFDGYPAQLKHAAQRSAQMKQAAQPEQAADSGLLSVTVIADNAANADALSTAVFVLGYEKGRALIESLPGTEAVFIFKDLKVRKTRGADFTLTDDSFLLDTP